MNMEQSKAYRIIQHLISKKPAYKHRNLIRHWLISGEDTDEIDNAIHNVWNETDAIADESIYTSLAYTHSKIGQAQKQKSRRRFVKRLIRYAAILLLPLISGLTVWFMSDEKQVKIELIECYVTNGERRTVELSDGSLVQVNSGSLFIYPKEFTGEERTVYLAGEANFSVKSDLKKNFIVGTKALQVQVVGTKFNVESYPENDQTIVTLEHGAVKVYKDKNPEKSILMNPNEQLTYSSAENRFTLSQVTASSFAAWTSGELYFSKKTLSQILETLERHYDVKIQRDPLVDYTDHYTMRIRSYETIEDALNVLIQIVDNKKITYKKSGQTIYLLPKGKEVKQ
jgi:ferric-dicitrate binding protein FerR (iron transport regulator)